MGGMLASRVRIEVGVQERLFVTHRQTLYQKEFMDWRVR